MSTTTSYDDALDLLPNAQAPAQASARSASVFARIRLVGEAVHEGHVAAARYQALKSSGIAHDEAARQVFAEVYGVR